MLLCHSYTGIYYLQMIGKLQSRCLANPPKIFLKSALASQLITFSDYKDH